MLPHISHEPPIVIRGRELENRRGVQARRKPDPVESGWGTYATGGGGSGARVAPQQEASHADAARLVAELVEAARNAVNVQADVEQTVGRVQQQIQESIEQETDPGKLRHLLTASETLLSLTERTPEPVPESPAPSQP